MNTSNGNEALAGIAYRDVVEAEHALVIAEFEKLKSRGDGELRVSTRRNPSNGVVEIIYLGVHEKADLTTVRKLYEQCLKKRVTF